MPVFWHVVGMGYSAILHLDIAFALDFEGICKTAETVTDNDWPETVQR